MEVKNRSKLHHFQTSVFQVTSMLFWEIEMILAYLLWVLERGWETPNLNDAKNVTDTCPPCKAYPISFTLTEATIHFNLSHCDW